MDLKKCTNCSRAPQPLDQFEGRSTCLKCREKGRRLDHKPERREKHNALQNEKKYYKAWREKQIEERPDEYRAHNNEVHRGWVSDNREHVREWYRTSVNSRLDAIKRSAMKRDLPWELEDDTAKSLMTSACVYCGLLELDVRANGIDRLDSSKGYTIENCVPCCKSCNFMKGTFDPLTFVERCRKIAQCAYEFPKVPRNTDQKRRP
jgi:hypothetical protein